MTPSRPADSSVREGRWVKAQHFAEAAELHLPVDDEGTFQGGDLCRLLGLKTKAGCTHRPVSRRDVQIAEKALEKLMSTASVWARR